MGQLDSYNDGLDPVRGATMTGFRELLSQARAGDSQAIATLFRDYGDLLLKVVRRHLNPAMRTQVDSADFVQEAWLAVLENPGQKANFETPQQFGAFLATVARNKVVDVVRRGLMSQGFNVNREIRMNTEEGVRLAPSHRDTPSKSAIRRELQDALVNGLKPGYREIGRKIFQGNEPAAIAAEMRVSTRTVERVRKSIVDQLHTL